LTVVISAPTATAPASGRREVREVSPEEFRQEVSGRTVTVMLTDGRHFKAQVSEVSNETMRLKVTQSSAGSDFATGSEHQVRFGDVGTVAYVKQRGKAHWLLPAVVGGVGGLMIFTTFASCSTEGGIYCPRNEAWSVGLTAGGTAAAAYGGYRLDRVEVQLHVRGSRKNVE